MNEDNNDTITLMHPCLHVGLINIPLQCEQWCSGKLSLVGTLAWQYYGHTLSLWGGGGGRVPE